MPLSRHTLFLIVIAVVLGQAFLSPAPLSAHARLVSSNPSSGSALAVAPRAITLTFSEEIDVVYSGASLFAQDGAPVPIGAVTATGDGRVMTVSMAETTPLDNGAYTLAWRAFSAVDAHVTSGTVAFSVGTGAAPATAIPRDSQPPWWRVAIRWIEIAAFSVATGFAAFALLVTRQPLFVVDRRLQHIARFAAATALVGVLIEGYDLGIRAVDGSFLDPPGFSLYRELALDSRSGRAWLVRLGSAAALALILGKPRSHRPARLAAFAMGIVGFGSLAISGHAAAASPAWPSMLAHWLHAAAMATWLGSLFSLWLSLRRPEDAAQIALVVMRFSRLGLAAFAVIFLSGLVRAAGEVSGSRNLTTADYGRVLIVKHALVVALLIAAAANRLVLVPKLRTSGIDAARLLRNVRAYAGIELAVAGTVLAAAAALTQIAPATSPLPIQVASRPVTIDQRAEAGDLSVWLLARLAGEAGDRFTIAVTDLSGNPPDGLQKVIVQTRIAVAGAEAGDRFDAEPLAGSPNTFVFSALKVGLPGAWQIEVIARRAGVEDVVFPFSIDTSAAAPAPPRLVEDDWRLPRPSLLAWLFTFAAVASLLGGVLLTKLLRGLEPLAAGIVLTMTALITAGFAIQGYRQSVPVSAGSDLRNPVPADADSIQRGEASYRALCLQCHGPDAAGPDTDDPEHGHSGANLLDDRTQRQRDGDLFWAITNGVGGTEMPAYDRALTDAERWDLVNYLRSLEPPPESAPNGS